MLINKIIPLSHVDGPGNRLVIFLQECNLNCLYCHNFETINQCNNCLACIATCPTQALTEINGKVNYDESLCIDCDACIYTCQHNATPKTINKTSAEVTKMILSYKDFIDGVTFSGGEATLQYQEMIEIVKGLKEYDINILIDSNGYFDYEEMNELTKLVDGYMIDLKTLNNGEKLVGVPDTPLDNIDKLIKDDKLAELRTVDLNDEESKLTIAKIDELIQINPSVSKRINKLAAQSLHPNRLAQLNEYLNENLQESME